MDPVDGDQVYAAERLLNVRSRRVLFFRSKNWFNDVEICI